MAVRVLGQMIRALRHWPDQDRVLGLAERRLKPVPPDLCRGTVFGDEKIFGEMYFFLLHAGSNLVFCERGLTSPSARVRNA